MKAKKSLGQNFLIDNNIIQKIVNNITADSSDLIVEIGPGQGALTKLLKEKKAYLYCYEIDSDLIPTLKKLEDAKTKIIEQDILNANIKEDIKNIKYKNMYIVGNLPYYITTPIIEKIIEENLTFQKFVIMVQKEVADRFKAKPHSKDYGYFTVMLNYFFNIEKICDVSRNCFTPAPKVESSVISLIPKEQKEKLNTKEYFNFLKECFHLKRKTLKNNLSNYNWNIILDVLKKYGYNEKVRAEELTSEVFISLYKALY